MKKESVVAVDLKTIMEIKGMSLGSQDLAEVNGKKRHKGVVRRWRLHSKTQVKGFDYAMSDLIHYQSQQTKLSLNI